MYHHFIYWICTFNRYPKGVLMQVVLWSVFGKHWRSLKRQCWSDLNPAAALPITVVWLGASWCLWWLTSESSSVKCDNNSTVLIWYNCYNSVPQTRWLSNGDLLSHNVRVSKPEINMLARFVPSEGCEGESAPGTSPTFFWLAGNLWHSSVYPSLPSSSPGGLPMCNLCPYSPFHKNINRNWIKGPPKSNVTSY